MAPAAAKDSESDDHHSHKKPTDSLQEESSKQLTKALDSLEDGLDADVAKALDGLVGVHRFDDQQQEVFQYLVAQMRHCAMGLFALAGVVTLILVKQVSLAVWWSATHAPFATLLFYNLFSNDMRGPSPRMQIWEGKSIPLPGISLAGVAVSQISHSLNAVVVAALMWAGAVSFKKVVSQEENQLAYAFQVRNSRGFLWILNILNLYDPIFSCQGGL